MSLIRLLLENLNSENTERFQTFYIADDDPSDELNDYLDDNGLDYYDDILSQIDEIQRGEEINILRGKEINTILIDTENHIVAGILWTEIYDIIFSFDIIINKLYRGKNLSHMLIDNALNEYNAIKNDYGKKLQIVLDVVNSKMENLLKTKYNFKVTKRIDGHTIMKLTN